MLLQTMHAQRLLNAYKLVTCEWTGRNSQGHTLSFVGNVKALFKLNEENESMEKGLGGGGGGNVECQLQKEGTCDREKKKKKKKWDALRLHPFMTILTSSALSLT